MSDQMRRLVESRMNAMQEAQQGLVRTWAPYLKAVKTALKEKYNRDITPLDERNIAQCLENGLLESSSRSRLFEATTSDNIAFLGVQLPVIAAMLPSLVLNKIAVVQALDRRNGSIFFMDLKYGQDKGAVVAGTSMLSSKVGHDRTVAGRRYASTMVEGETASVSFTTKYFPIIPGTLVITTADETLVDNGMGVLVSDVTGGSGAISSYTTGVVTVTFGGAAVNPKASYRYNYEKATNGVPEVDFTLTSESCNAQDFPLKTNYTLTSAIDLEKAHGLNLEDEMVKYLGGEVKFEIDHFGIDMIATAAESADAADPITNWAANPTSGQEWLWKKYEFLDRLELGSNNIFAKTQRAFGTYILAGNNAARVIRQLTDRFKPASGLDSVSPTGPIELGTLDGRVVIQDPFLDTNRYYMGYTGDNIMKSSFVFAPYIPLFATNTLITADLKAQKGFLSSAGFKVVNAGFFTYGTISGL